MTHQVFAWTWGGEERCEAGGRPADGAQHTSGDRTLIGVADEAGRVQEVWLGGGILVPCPLRHPYGQANPDVANIGHLCVKVQDLCELLPVNRVQRAKESRFCGSWC